MIDIFKDYFIQREELLARIAQELQLDKSRSDRMEIAYNAVADLLKRDNDFFDKLEIEVYAQGSKRTGTTVKPINGEDFDLDIVLHIYDPYYNHSPEEIFNALVRSLEKDSYYKEIMEKKSRCVRLNYKSDFHMDILPGCMPDLFQKEMIMIPEKALKSWTSGNPKGFSKWFLEIAVSAKEPYLRRYAEVLLKAQVETEKLPTELYLKSPLQRGVQLIKRCRDIYFQDKDFRVSSIVLTTLIAQFYEGEESIFETLDQVVNRIKASYLDAFSRKVKFKVINPVNPDEDFTDSWTDRHYESFYNFISDFHKKWNSLKNSFESSKEDYIQLFGEGVYKKALSDQAFNFRNSTKDYFAKSSGLITSGKALTDFKGNINTNSGYKNEPHYNFGE